MLHGNISKLNCVPGFNHGRGTGKISLEGSKLQWTCMLILHVLGPLNWLHGAILFFTFLDEECKKSEIPGISKCISYHHSGRNKKIYILSSVGKQPYSSCLSLFDISLLKMNGCSLISVTVFSCSSFWHLCRCVRSDTSRQWSQWSTVYCKDQMREIDKEECWVS